MKKTETFTKCEFCDNFISLQSPPPNKSYENAQIHILDGTILLPQKLVEKGAHSKGLAGYYCKPKCLIGMIKKIVGKVIKI